MIELNADKNKFNIPNLDTTISANYIIMDYVYLF